MTQFPDLFARLCAPFEDREVRVRSQGGRQLSYITARTAMNRLDTALGPECWWDEYLPGEHSVICKLTVRLPDGSTLTKSDAGGYAGMADQGDDDKSGFSDAFKRAAVKFGVGRYLYRDGVPDFASKDGKAPEPPDASKVPRDRHDPEPEPARGRDQRQAGGQPPQGQQQQRQGGAGGGQPSAPRTGRALFAWAKEQEQRHEVGLIKYLNGWAKLQDYPKRLVDFDADQVAHAYQEATRKLSQTAADDARQEYED